MASDMASDFSAANVADSNPIDAAAASSTDAAPTTAPTVASNYSQVFFKSDGKQLFLTLPPEVDPEGNPIAWNDVLQQLRQRLEGSERFWPPQTEIYLKAEDRLLDVRQLQSLVEALAETQLVIKRVSTSRRQTALAAITAGYSVDQHAAVDHLVQAPPTPGTPLADPLYLQTTVRSGVDIRHPGMIVILGDTNPGSSLIADGDIIVWGRLRGMAHAGCQGDRTCRIMALQMQPTQLRIADLVARPPDAPPAEYWPEVAYVGSDAIRIARAQDFARTQLSPGGLGFET